jgi:hypothetical protein
MSTSFSERVAERERLRHLCAADRARLRLVWRLPPRVAGRKARYEGWRVAVLGASALAAWLLRA